MTDPARTTAIILAAGGASRFGAVKLLAELDGVPLLERVLAIARAAGVDEIVVVLGEASSDVESAIDLGDTRIVRNPHPADGLSSSLRLGLAAVGEHADAALVLLGDQPLVRADVVAAVLAAAVPDGRSIVVPRYADDGALNPALLLRASWPLAEGLSGDRGMGPVIRAHPELVVEVPVDGDNPDVDTPADLALVEWARRVRANREQVDRVREVGDGDFYASGTSLFIADPRRSDADDATLAALRSRAWPGQRWLDVGAGAGRYALPLALAVARGEVTAVEVSAAMLSALREGMATHGIENVRIVEGRWPAVAKEAGGGFDAALIAHVGYDIESIGPFLDALEAAAATCVAVMMDRTPASVAEPFWPPVHGEARIPLPAMPEFVALLRARGRSPEVRLVESTARSYVDRDQALGLLRRQTWVRPDGEKDRLLQALLDERTIQRPDGRIALRDVPELQIGIVTWGGSGD
jgi:CTP:molybdopterin cytidylyltransferase MocA/SAM-dependent methyltransferase